MVGFGIIGCGAAGETHAAALAELSDARLVALADPVLERATGLAERFGGRAVGAVDELLACPEVDAVSLCVPHDLHAPYALAAARAGKHALVEKPCTTTVDDGARVVRAFREADLRLGVMLQTRFTDAMRAVTSTVVAGQLGRPYLASAVVPCRRTDEYFGQAPWRASRERAGGGALTIQGIHLLDAILALLGPPSSVGAMTATNARQADVEDTAIVSLRFPSGAVAGLTATTVAWQQRPSSLVVHAEHGSADLEEAGGQARATLHLRDGSRQVVGAMQTELGREVVRPTALDVSPYRAVIADFVAAIGERRAPRIDGEQGLLSVRVIEAAYRAAALKKEVQIDADECERKRA